MDWITPIKEKLSKKERQTLIYTARIILARKYFYYYCKAMFPKYYTDDTPYLREICDSLQKCYEGKLINSKTGLPIKRIIINAPPRHYKSLTMKCFEEWMMGNDQSKSVITVCYNTKLSTKFARGVRDGIQTRKQKGNKKIIFADVFPNVKIKKGYGGVGEWALNNNNFNFLASSFTATISGFGATGAAVIDDQINTAEDAKNDTLMAANWEFFCDTLLQRTEKGAMVVVNMTRWCKSDICGMLEESGDIDNWLVLKYEVKNLKTGEMLNHHVMDNADYQFKKKMMSEEIFSAIYHQRPVDSKGRLYKSFQTYETLPTDLHMITAQIKTKIDPSEKNDNYCCVTYIKHKGCAYVLDIFYENKVENMNTDKVCDFLIKNGSQIHEWESNKSESGGQDIQRVLMERKYNYPEVKFYYTTKDKLTKIKESAFWVQKIIFFPANWATKYARFYFDLMHFYCNGKDKHDDAPDVISQIKEDLMNSTETKGEVGIYSIKPNNKERYGELKLNY